MFWNEWVPTFLPVLLNTFQNEKCESKKVRVELTHRRFRTIIFNNGKKQCLVYGSAFNIYFVLFFNICSYSGNRSVKISTVYDGSRDSARWQMDSQIDGRQTDGRRSLSNTSRVSFFNVWVRSHKKLTAGEIFTVCNINSVTSNCSH